MKILLLGYGKMGRAIEDLALQRGHKVLYKVQSGDDATLATLAPETVDVAIEFSQPNAAYANIHWCLAAGIPVVSGTTGWLEKKAAIDSYCLEQDGTFFYASNFSIGMNIFFKVNAFLAKIMNTQPGYEVSLEEVHHLAKKDAPSGTAITLAQTIVDHLARKEGWQLSPTQIPAMLEIMAEREEGVPGTHTVNYTTAIDTLTLKHVAHSREGFALGAMLAAEWVLGRKGVLGMDDFLQLDGTAEK